MKKIIILLALILVALSQSTMAQTGNPNLNQNELIKQLYGNWHTVYSKDTIDVFEIMPYNNALGQTNYRLLNEKKNMLGIGSYRFDPKLDKFRFYVQYPNGGQSIWLGQFVSDKKIVYDRVEDLKTMKIVQKCELTLTSPNSSTIIYSNPDGIETSNRVWIKSNSVPPNTNPELNQLELIQKLIGTWYNPASKETIGGLKVEKYQNTIMAYDITVIDGKESLNDRWLFGFSKSENQFKIYGLWPNGGYTTRIGFFTEPNKFVQYFVRNLNPSEITGSVEIVLENPENWNVTFFNAQGEVTSKARLVKMK